MDLNGVPTPCMDWNCTNLPEAWRKFQQHTDLILRGPLKDKGDDVKITYLLLWIGDKGRDIFDTLSLSEEQKTSLNAVCGAIKLHIQPKCNPVFSRYKFNNEIQGENTVEQFLTKLKLLAQGCNYADPDEMIRDRIVFGIKSQKVRERLITEGDKLTLDKATQICQSIEYAQEQLRTMNQPTSSGANTDVNAVRTRMPPQQPRRYPASPAPTGDRQARNKPPTWKPNGSPRCRNCGQTHDKYQCPARGQQCHYCQKWNHFAKMCLSKSKNVNDVQAMDNCDQDVYDHSELDVYSDVYVDSVESRIINGQVYAEIQVGPTNRLIKFKIDTGAQVNILPYSVFQKLNIKLHFKNPTHSYPHTMVTHLTC